MSRTSYVLAFLCVLGLGFLPGPALAGVDRWTSFGPGGGRIPDLEVRPAAPRTIYAAASVAGLYRSEDGGATWAWSAKGMAGENVVEVALDPANPAVLYAGSARFELPRSGKVFRSDDGGRSWRKLAELGFVTSLAVAPGAPGTPGTVYAGIEQDLYRSRDRGATWEQVLHPELPNATEAAVTDIVVSPADPQTVYVSVLNFSFFGGVYKTTDGGATWAQLDLPGDLAATGVRALALAPSNPAVLYAASGNLPVVYRSADGGTSWRTSSALPHPDALTVDPAAPDTVYAGGTEGVYRTLNGGETWESTRQGLPGASWTSDPNAVLSLEIDPAHPRTLYAGTSAHGVFQSVNRGQLWSPRNHRSLSAAPIELVAFHPTRPRTVFAALRAGGDSLYVTNDNGVTWRLASEDLRPAGAVQALAFDRENPRRMYAGGTNGLYQSTDGGVHWSRACLDPSVHVLSLLTFDGGAVVAGGEVGFGAFRSTDRGTTWKEALAGAYMADPTQEVYRAVEELVSDPERPDVIYAEVFEGARLLVGTLLYKSTNGGKTWTRILGDGREPVLDAGRSSTVYAVSSPGRILRSTNAGKSWRQVTDLGVHVWDLTADREVPGRLYVATQGQGVLRSDDGGITWEPLNTGLAVIGRRHIAKVEVRPHAPTRLLALPYEGGLFEARFRD